MRIGHGLDAHRLVPGRPLMLGGVHVPHDRGLQGHSDGDVVAHALASAVLGAAGLGDLGRHFPGIDRWEGVSGLELLSRVGFLLGPAGFRLESAQAVVVAEHPRLFSHLDAMNEALTQALSAASAAVVVTATSSDGMGFTGRGEGMAASAVALLAPLS